MQETGTSTKDIISKQDTLPLPVNIIIPFYQHEELVPPLFAALYSIADELNEMQASLILINDSPGYTPLVEELEKARLQCKNYNIACNLLTNEENLGFLRTTNRGLQLSSASCHDVILLNSDTIPTIGALKEIQRIAYSDAKIGFVSPRSNNADYCSFPNDGNHALLDFDRAYKGFKAFQSCLPNIIYTPTVVGFCMYIKSEVLFKIGFLDEIYRHGYYEEYDYVFRGSRQGYKAALANHAYVYHKGAASIVSKPTAKEMLLAKNKCIFEERYPEYVVSISAYFSSGYYKAERLVHRLLSHSVFDFTPLSFLKIRVAKLILKKLSKRWHKYFIKYSSNLMKPQH